MKSNVKTMLLGITIMLFGIYLKTIFIENLHGSLIEIIWVILPIIGALISLYGFFSHEKSTEKIEKIYAIIEGEKERNFETVSCEKCGESYKSVYSSCPHCGYRKN